MKSCLIVIDAQESFRQRPYWSENVAQPYFAAQNALIEGCLAAGIPIVRIFHVDGPAAASHPFAVESGFVRPIEGLAAFEAAATFTKHRHSALVNSGLDIWLTQHGIGRLIVSGIRTEQCCETTTRHASDLGWEVDYVTEATLTFDMLQPDGRPLAAADIKARTAAVLDGRFATVCSVAQALQRAGIEAGESVAA
ncbi:isochorismatase family protein [Variovorax paradoxus]|uniref:isochorismatase family protein n=1 Tax=Variovorax paradoxus TaxID=34073 RepID=UPI00277E900E|nr:isochorismatase family protein [Variovorax paradoxus]MDQ0587058.1 nicotinamidase-related amidase [Variovorax paradoxus]